MIGFFKKKKSPTPDSKFKLVFKPGSIEGIMFVKGIRSQAELAKELGCSKAYVSMLKKRACPVTHEIICKVAELTGKRKWWANFDMVEDFEKKPLSHPSYNYAKHDGKVPYVRYSTSAEFRRKDNPNIETA